MLQPVNGNRVGVLALQKDVHVNLAPARATTFPAGEDAPAKLFAGVDVRRWHPRIEVRRALHAVKRLQYDRSACQKRHGGSAEPLRYRGASHPFPRQGV